MAGNTINEIDYSGLNKSLQPKRKMNLITDGTAEALGKVFTSELKTKATKTERIDALSDQIKEGSENMKVRLILTLNYLSNEGLLKPEAIKSLSAAKIREIAGGQNSNQFLKENDKKIQNIIDYLINGGRKKGEELTAEQKEKLNQAVIDGLDAHYGNLAEKEDMSEQLKEKNEELEEELKASEIANDTIISALSKRRRSRKNALRVLSAIQRININKDGLDPATKARKVLWQANHKTIFGTGKRFDRVNKLPSKFNIKEEYNNIVDKLDTEMKATKDSEVKIAIRAIMKQVDKAYQEYMDAISVDDETRRKNIKNINMAMAA